MVNLKLKNCVKMENGDVREESLEQLYSNLIIQNRETDDESVTSNSETSNYEIHCVETPDQLYEKLKQINSKITEATLRTHHINTYEYFNIPRKTKNLGNIFLNTLLADAMLPLEEFKDLQKEILDKKIKNFTLPSKEEILAPEADHSPVTIAYLANKFLQSECVKINENRESSDLGESSSEFQTATEGASSSSMKNLTSLEKKEANSRILRKRNPSKKSAKNKTENCVKKLSRKRHGDKSNNERVNTLEKIVSKLAGKSKTSKPPQKLSYGGIDIQIKECYIPLREQLKVQKPKAAAVKRKRTAPEVKTKFVKKNENREVSEREESNSDFQIEKLMEETNLTRKPKVNIMDIVENKLIDQSKTKKRSNNNQKKVKTSNQNFGDGICATEDGCSSFKENSISLEKKESNSRILRERNPNKKPIKDIKILQNLTIRKATQEEEKETKSAPKQRISKKSPKNKVKNCVIEFRLPRKQHGEKPRNEKVNNLENIISKLTRKSERSEPLKKLSYDGIEVQIKKFSIPLMREQPKEKPKAAPAKRNKTGKENKKLQISDFVLPNGALIPPQKKIKREKSKSLDFNPNQPRNSEKKRRLLDLLDYTNLLNKTETLF